MKKTPSPVEIFGIPFFPHTEQEARKWIEERLSERRNLRIFTPNPEILWSAHQDPHRRQQLYSADLLLPDGIGVFLAAKLLKTPLPQRITGIDTGEWLLEVAARQGLTVYLLGGKTGVAEQARLTLTERLPSLRVCGAHHGYFDPSAQSEENQTVLKEIQQAAPDLLFVCLGSPAQEQWIYENTPYLPSLRLSIGLGGALDVWSGALPRAPKLLRRCGMEWCWRVIREPKRLRRLRVIPPFLIEVIRSRRKKAPTDP